ncbi:MAG: TCR/Tet family MFS transporter [Bacteroidetes bacterium]|nr:TCR/Tet family MFS transporter [Bacteroidota bacterium]
MKNSDSRRALTFIFVTVLIDIIGWGIIIPVMPKLLATLGHTDVSTASKIGGWLSATYAIMQFFCAPLLGAISDRFGRRPVLLMALAGFCLDYIFLANAPTVAWLFVGRFIAGITGASFSVASAFIADVSPPEKRAQNFGLIGAAFGLGFIVGPALGGLVAGYGLRAPFWLAAALCAANFIYGYFFIPESLAKEHRRIINWKRANPVGSLMQLRKYPVVSGLVVSLTLIYLGAHAVQSNWSYYTAFRFDWSEGMIGFSLALVGLLIGGVQGGLIRVVNPWLGNKKAVLVGLALYTLGMSLFGIANQGWMMFAILVPYCLGGIAGPALQGIISTQVPPNAQGELQGALTSLMSSTSIFGPLIMNNTFYFFSHEGASIYFPGAPFILGAIFLLAALIFATSTLKHRYQETRLETQTEFVTVKEPDVLLRGEE